MKKTASLILLSILLVIICREHSKCAEILTYAVFPAPPYMIGAEDENSPMSGIDVDIVREIAKRGGYEIRFIRAPWKRVLELIKNGDADILSSCYLTPERKKFAAYFDRPYLKSLPIAFYYRKDSGISIEKYTDLYRYSGIGVLRGASYFKRFDTDSKIGRVEITTQEQMYPMLLHGRIPIFAGYIPTEHYFLHNYEFREMIERSKFVYNEPAYVYIAISRKSPVSRNFYRLNSIHTALHNEGFISKTVTSYYAKYSNGRK